MVKEISLNPYQLCDFNCIYCYIRDSRYRENMKQGLVAKVNALDLLERELLKIANGFIALSSATKSWMRIEKKYWRLLLNLNFQFIA